MEATMDDEDDKTIIEKLVDTVKNVASDIATTASNAAQYAMESDTTKMEPNSEAVAEMTNEQMYKPTAMPSPVVPKKRPAPQKADKTKPSPSLSGRITPAYDIPVPSEPMLPLGTEPALIEKIRKKTPSKNTAPKVGKKTGKKSGKKLAAKNITKARESAKQSAAPRAVKSKATRRVAKKNRPKKMRR
jgi:hypothetical protein